MCVYTSVSMCVYTSVSTCVYTSVSMCVNTSVSMCVYTSVSMCLCVCIYVCLYVCIYVFLYVCIYVCLYVCFYVCLYVCIYVLHVCMSTRFVWRPDAVVDWNAILLNIWVFSFQQHAVCYDAVCLYGMMMQTDLCLQNSLTQLRLLSTNKMQFDNRSCSSDFWFLTKSSIFLTCKFNVSAELRASLFAQFFLILTFLHFNKTSFLFARHCDNSAALSTYTYLRLPVHEHISTYGGLL